MISEGYYKHVEYKRLDPRTGKLITVKGGRTPGINISVNTAHNTDDEHMSALHAVLKQVKPATEHSLQQHVHAHVLKNYTGSEKSLTRLKNQMLRELFNSGAVAVKDPKTGKTKQVIRHDNPEVQEKLDILGINEKTLLRSLVPPGFDVSGSLSVHLGGLHVSGIVTQNGVRCGRFLRVFHCEKDRRRLDVVNDLFMLNETVQNKGFGSLFTMCELDAVEKLSKRFKEPTHVSLAAATRGYNTPTEMVGAYVWPKIGFTVTKKSFQLLLQKARLLPDEDLTYLGLTRVDMMSLAKSATMDSFLKHPKAKAFLTTVPCELDCETVLGSSGYKTLRKNLSTIIGKHSKGAES